ncbi:MAG: TonB family protein [Desulfocapsaceae bacterium]|nr:TonB family protein [Desulfocapsaceae bacterium]
MKLEARALSESFVLHGLLTGAIIIMAGAFTPPPPPIRLDFSMLQPALSPAPQETVQAQAAVAAPTPPETTPTPPAPQPEPVALPQKLAPVASKIRHAPQPAIPAPQHSQEQNSPEVTATTAPAPVAAEPIATTASASATDAPGIPADEEYRRLNFGAIRHSILANLHYPMLARRRGWSGQVEIVFKISPDGSVSELRIATSSGFSVLDDQALAAIRHSAPFTPPPPIAAILVMPVNFQLN